MPESGDALVTGVAILLTLAGPAAAQRIRYPAIASGEIVPVAGPHSAARPHLPYPHFPADMRIAPGDFASDPGEQARVDGVADRIVLAQLSQNYRPRPALWRIGLHRVGGRDTTIYLFGTMHVLPPGFAWRSAAVERAMAASDTLIVESVDDAEVPATTMRAPLARRVSPRQRATYARFAASLPPRAADALDTMPTWMAAVAIGYARELQAGETPGPGADDWLEGWFRAHGRAVVPIEDGRRVFARIGAIAEGTQRRMLDAALDARQTSRASSRAPLHAWARGDVGPGSALTIELDRETGTDALDGPLLTERNRAWVDALTERLRVPGTAFLAAGVSHFVGRQSVLLLLERRGVRVKRVD